MNNIISTQHPVVLFVGTRPEVIKLASVARELQSREIPFLLVSTGQHQEMLQQALQDLDLSTDLDFQLMRENQSLASLSARVLERTEQFFSEHTPSWVVVQGDTTTVAMVSLAAFYRQIPVAHVEAGLRTNHPYDPFPEEMNRSLVGRLARLHLAPTETARTSLLGEGIADARIHVTGNSVIDALLQMQERVVERSAVSLGLPSWIDSQRVILVTAHRRENLGGGLQRVFQGLKTLALELGPTIQIVYPVHLNPKVQTVAEDVLSEIPNVHLLPPLGYRAFVKVMTRSELIVTDSGGVQEEATAIGIPTLVTRNTSERPEAIRVGVAQLVGTETLALVTAAHQILARPVSGRNRSPHPVYGDGHAAKRIVNALLGEQKVLTDG